jgi:hypothetical protein
LGAGVEPPGEEVLAQPEHNKLKVVRIIDTVLPTLCANLVIVVVGGK